MRIQLVSWLSFMFCYWCRTHLGIAISAVHGQCLDNQQSLLLQLKRSLQFKHEFSRKLASWNESSDCCTWNGVKCDDEGHVSVLDLSGESIHDGFDDSSSLFNLQNLQVLNLATNNFSSVIPSGFNKLKYLTYLNLSYAGFVGQIPIGISQLTSLVTLDISSFSYLTWQKLELKNPNLQKIVQNLTRIKQLYLDGVSITAQGQEWGKALLQLRNLQELSMSNCNLQGPIPDELMNFIRLSSLNLSHNALAGPISSSIGNLKQLESLDLSRNNLDGEIPTQLASLNFLSYLNLSFNKFSGTIPTGTQLQTFPEGSFQGNAGLCGPPLTTSCSNPPLPPSTSDGNTDSGSFIDWNFMSVVLFMGLALLFCR